MHHFSLGFSEIVFLSSNIGVSSAYTILSPDSALWDYTGYVVIGVAYEEEF